MVSLTRFVSNAQVTPHTGSRATSTSLESGLSGPLLQSDMDSGFVQGVLEL